MNSNQLASILSKNPITAPYFRGICPSDRMIKSKKPYCFVSNTDKHDEAGTH